MKHLVLSLALAFLFTNYVHAECNAQAKVVSLLESINFTDPDGGTKTYKAKKIVARELPCGDGSYRVAFTLKKNKKKFIGVILVNASCEIIYQEDDIIMTEL